jgi:hypothetical protein
MSRSNEFDGSKKISWLHNVDPADQLGTEWDELFEHLQKQGAIVHVEF